MPSTDIPACSGLRLRRFSETSARRKIWRSAWRMRSSICGNIRKIRSGAGQSEILAGNDRTVQGYRPVPAAGETADGLHGRDVAADGNDPGSTGAGGRNKSCPNAGPGAADGAGPGDFALKILFRPKARGNRQSHRPDGEAGGKTPLPDEAAAVGNTDGGAG